MLTGQNNVLMKAVTRLVKNSSAVTFLILKQKTSPMLAEKAESFSKTDDDVGRAEELQVNINLTDSVAVQRKYTAIPRPLYAEVKQYVEDLLNLGWIEKSKSAYSSPVVCVWKKDGSLRLCTDYRQLNSKTICDSHPLPRVQDALESLGGNQWFSLLDQGKAYHQGFVNSRSRHKTAFATPWGPYEWFAYQWASKIYQENFNALWNTALMV